MHVCMCVCMYVCRYVCIYVGMYVFLSLSLALSFSLIHYTQENRLLCFWCVSACTYMYFDLSKSCMYIAGNASTSL